MFPSPLHRFLVFCLLSGLLACGLSASCQDQKKTLALPATPQAISFRWLANGDQAYSALLLPVQLPGSPRTFYLQFDMGAPYTLFYREAVQDILQRYPKALDTTGGRVGMEGRLDNTPLSVRNAVLRDHAGSRIGKKDALPIIGTFGSDLVAGRALLLDFPARQLLLNVDSSLTGAVPLSDLMFIQGRILLPATIGGAKKMLVYDSGSSAYALITDSASALRMARPGATDERQSSRSWTTTLTAHSFATNDSIGVAGKLLPLGKVTYMEGASAAQIQSMARFGIGGMTGNALFLGQRLFLDLGKQKWALLP